MKFRKKPIVIEAAQWDGENFSSIAELAINGSRIVKKEKTSLFIKTLEGTMEARKGDWIIKGINGEVYPCKPDIFEKTYEKLYPYEIGKFTEV